MTLPSEELAALKAKLRAREGQPGFAANVAELRAEIDRIEASEYVFRSSITGKFVSEEYALANPATTYRQRFR